MAVRDAIAGALRHRLQGGVARLANGASVALRAAATSASVTADNLIRLPQWVAPRRADQFATHPGHDVNPLRVRGIYQIAEQGDIALQCDLWDDVLDTDGHLLSLVKQRVMAVAGREFVVQPGDDQDPKSVAAADAFRRAISRSSLNIGELFEHMLESPFKGFSAASVRWERWDGLTVPAEFWTAPHRRFRIGVGNELLLMPPYEAGGSMEGEPLWGPGHWVVATERHTNLARAGLLRNATWWSIFKRFSMRDWVIFAERFGIPYVFGRYRGGVDEKHISKLEAAVRDIGEAGQSVFPEGLDVVISDIAQRAGDAKSVHPAIINVCNAEMSKLIAGATQNVDTGTSGSYAQASVHEGRSYVLAVADAIKLQRVLRMHLAKPFAMANGFEGAVAPKIRFRVMREFDPKRLAEVAKILSDIGIPFDRAALLDELGFKPAANDEEEVEEVDRAA